MKPAAGQHGVPQAAEIHFQRHAPDHAKVKASLCERRGSAAGFRARKRRLGCGHPSSMRQKSCLLRDQGLTSPTTFRRGAVRRVGALLGSGHGADPFSCKGAGDKGSERWRPREKTTRTSGPGFARGPEVCASRRRSCAAYRAVQTARGIRAMRDADGTGRGAAFRGVARHKR